MAEAADTKPPEAEGEAPSVDGKPPSEDDKASSVDNTPPSAGENAPAGETPTAENAAAGPEKVYNLSGDFRYAVVNIQSTIVGADVARDIETQPPEPGESPYLGLQYFSERDADHFFGRELLTARVIAHLARSRFLAVIGASGSGKSSLVRAGVIPALKRGATLADDSQPPPGSAAWTVRVLSPSVHPLEALAAALSPEGAALSAIADLVQSLRDRPASLALAARALLARDASPTLLLVVDQFEEVFTQCHDETERRAFIDGLVSAACTGDEQPIRLILVIRADFYASLGQYDPLREAVAAQQAFIGAMQRDELARAILQPAALGNWKIQEGLVEQMLDDTGDEPGALPLLSHALLETWNHRRGRTLTLSAYRESGGVRGAIARTAEQVFRQRLTPEQQAIARIIFLRLVDLEDDSPDTRRRVAFSELVTRASDPLTINAVIGILTDARLVTTGLQEPGDVQVLEVAHEALIREWPTLRQWLDENRAGLILHRQLSEATRYWLNAEQDAGALYRGGRLKQAQAWADQNPQDLSLDEQKFLEASQKQERDEAERIRQLQRAQLMRRLIFPLSTVAAVALLGVLFYLSGAYVRFLTPAKMDGVFNVAVAEFSQVGPGGALTQAPNGAGLVTSGWVTNDLRAQLGSDPNLLVWHDSPEIQRKNVKIGRVDGATPEVRVKAAEALAQRLNAQMVVFGSIDTRTSPAQLKLEFWLAPQAGYDFVDLRGTYQVADAVEIVDPAHPGIEAQPEINAQASTLAWVALGLSQMRYGQSSQALASFSKAESFSPRSAAVQFFIGRESLFLSDRDAANQEALTGAAEKAFRQAIQLDPQYAYAYIGLGGVYFARAKRLVSAVADQTTPGTTAPAQLASAAAFLKQADDSYQQALALPAAAKLPGMAVDPSARLGLATAARVRGEALYRGGQFDAANVSLTASAQALESIIPPLQAERQERLLAQTYQTLGTAYQWLGFLAETSADVPGSRAAYTLAAQAYDRCIALGKGSADRIVSQDIAATLCAPYRDQVHKRLDVLSGGS